MKTARVLEQKPDEVIQDATINGIVKTIAEHFHPRRIVLFGSYARGNPTPDSDIDILIEMETNLPRHKRSVSMRLLFRPMPCAVDFLVYTPAEIAKWMGTPNHVITEAFTRGKVLYERRV